MLYYNELYQKSENIHDNVLAISLSGPTLRTYTISIPVNMPDAEAKEKLINFKDSISIEFNLYSNQTNFKIFAFALVPTVLFEEFDVKLLKTKIFRDLFPVNLVGLYISSSTLTYSINANEPSI